MKHVPRSMRAPPALITSEGQTMFSAKIDALIIASLTVFTDMAALSTMSQPFSSWIPVSFAALSILGTVLTIDLLAGNPIAKMIVEARYRENP